MNAILILIAIDILFRLFVLLQERKRLAWEQAEERNEIARLTGEIRGLEDELREVVKEKRDKSGMTKVVYKNQPKRVKQGVKFEIN